MSRYLSLGWLDDMTAAAAGSQPVASAAETCEIGVTQVVTAGPEGDITYHLRAGGGDVRFGPGPADPEHVRFVQDWDTAVAVANGTLNAQEAFLTGRIRATGDMERLMACNPLFAALDPVFHEVRQRTEYA